MAIPTTTVELRERAAPRSAPRQTLLAVEDDDAFRHAVTRHLTEVGYVMIPVRTTMEGLDVIDAKCKFDALLIDIYMPPGNPHGISAAKVLLALAEHFETCAGECSALDQARMANGKNVTRTRTGVSEGVAT